MEITCPFSGKRIDGRPSDAEVTESAPLRGTLIEEAERFLTACYTELGCSSAELRDRLTTVRAELARRGTYSHTKVELAHGASMAWRNAARCVGRAYSSRLDVRDMRHLTMAEEVFGACVEHLRLAFNRGQIRPVITIFAPTSPDPSSEGPRIWNPQLVRYAGYSEANGQVIGDPMLSEFTDAVRELGWSGGNHGRFDVLPLVVAMPRARPKLFAMPPDAVAEVHLHHPDYPWFADLGLRWHAVPAISNMRLEIGGISYTAAPFSGWYVGYEIGARNLSDAHRYNMLEEIARRMNLETRRNVSLWKDRALLELNVAVLASFRAAGVTIIDHHTVTRLFVEYEEREHEAGRSTPAEWSWIVPALSGSITPVFHRAYTNVAALPNFFSQSDPWKSARTQKSRA